MESGAPAEVPGGAHRPVAYVMHARTRGAEVDSIARRRPRKVLGRGCTPSSLWSSGGSSAGEDAAPPGIGVPRHPASEAGARPSPPRAMTESSATTRPAATARSSGGRPIRLAGKLAVRDERTP